MLSVAAVRSASGAANYFAKDDYYTAEHASEATAWGGEGAKELGLTGEVKKEDFEKILNGILPSGEAVGQVENRQTGTDLTFSMPKSASVMAYVAGDTRVLAAHMEAVKKTMGWVEKTYAEGRTYERTKSGEPVKTGNLVYAIFQHDTSRALDPQGHLHVVIANMTKIADGAWRALHNGQIWKNNTTIGAAYHAQFSAELQKLGYRTEVTGKHGQFEIQGVPKEVLKEFSQRREDILAKAEELGIKSTEGLRDVTKRTRDPKLHVEDRQALGASWVARAEARGFDGKALVAEATARAGDSRADERPSTFGRLQEVIKDVAATLGNLFNRGDPLVDRTLKSLVSPADLRSQHAVASAVRMLEQREAAFSTSEVTHAALGLGLAGVTAERVDQRVSELIRTERLIPGTNDRIDKTLTHVITPHALATETKILAEIDRGRGAVAPIVAPDQVVERLQAAAGDRPLNAGQLAAATLALSSTDRIVAIQGVAGAGKSTTIAAIARVAEAEGKRVVGLAFQNKMVGDLREGAGIEAQTVSSFVNAYIRPAMQGQGEKFEAARAALSNTVVILDEASMVGNEPMQHLTTIANQLGLDKLDIIGDRQQIAAIDAGKSFSLIQAHGVALARMDDNLRQRTDQLRTVAALANVGRVQQALHVLGDKVIEVKGAARETLMPGETATPQDGVKDHVSAAADRWLGLSDADRERTAVFTSGRQARGAMNELIQDGLVEDGTLKGEAIGLTVLEQVNTTREEMRYAHSYKPGQKLEVARPVPDLKLRPGSYEVIGVDDRGRVEIKVDGKVRIFDPQKIDPLDKRDAMRLTEKQDITLRENDKIRWTMNDKERGLLNSDLARVVSVGKEGITVETATKQVVELKHGDQMLERLGLAYALNMHMAQGITTDRGIAVMGSYEQNLANQRLFNVTVTRVRDDIELFTDDKGKLGRQLASNEGNKTSALETVGRIEIDKPRDLASTSRQASAGEQPARAPQLDPLAMPARTGTTMATPGVEKNPEASRLPERHQDQGR